MLAAVASATGTTRRVPQDYPTIQNGVDAANPGDLVLIDKGTYVESVFVTTPSITLRGVDRNSVILDGKFEFGTGIMVGGNGVAVENMTARNYTLNGFFWTAVQRISRLLPDRLQQRRLRHLCLRLDGRSVRTFLRQRLARFRILRRPVRALPGRLQRRRR